MAALYHLIYISKEVEPFHQACLQQLIQHARFNNFIHQITGLLLYGEQQFIQVLEGTKENVEIIFEKILNDNRHYAIHVVKQGPIDERAFYNWNMGLTVFSQYPELKEKLMQRQALDEYVSLSQFNAVSIINAFSAEEFRGFIK